MSEIIDIEETLHFVEFGIVVLKVGNKKRYMKPRATNNKAFPFELFEISSEEKAKLGIIEESEHTESEGSEVEIEESLPEDRVPEMTEEEKENWKKEQEKKLKGNLTLSGSPEAVEAAKQILGKHLKTKEELAEENQELKERLDLASTVALDKKLDSLGVKDPELRNQFHKDPDSLMAYAKGLNREGQGSPSGSAPLQDNYYEQFKNKPEGDIAKRKFASHSEMVKFLKANEEDPEARKYIEALWKQTIQAMKNGEKITYNPQTDLKSESSQPVEVRLTGKERNDPNSELQQFLARANAKWRESKTRESERKKEVVKS